MQKNKLRTLDYSRLVEVIEEFISEGDFRVCSECGKIMNNGYCIENGEDYYCDSECLHINMTEEEFEKLYDEGNGDSYWTEWGADSCYYELIKYILEIRKDLNYKLQEM